MPCYLCLFWGLYKQLCSVLARGRGNMLRCMEPLGRRSKDLAPSFASAKSSGIRAVLPIAEPEEPCLGSLPLLLLLLWRWGSRQRNLPVVGYHLHF